MGRRIAVLLSGLVVMLGCRSEMPTSPAVSDHVVPMYSQGGSSELPEPGECTASIPLVPDGSGALADVATSCVIPDSVFVRVTVSGKLTASQNPDALRCSPGATSPAVGEYGPKGGGGTYNWLSLMVAVKGKPANGSMFSMGAMDPATGAGLSPGSGLETVLYFNQGLTGTNGTTIWVGRSGLVATVACQSALAPYPPGCEGGTSYSCGPLNVYRVNGTQTLHMVRAAATLRLTAQPAEVYEGDSVTFTASSTDG